jgi:type I restriction enzyme S subunit
MDTKLLKQKILDLAIRGKLVPQDPNDEPASVLLERIRAEREQLIKQGKLKRSKSTSDNQHYQNVPFEIPASWEWVPLKNLCKRFSTGPFGSMLHKSDYIAAGVPVVNPANIVNGAICTDKIMYISSAKAQELSKYLLSNDDILLARRGDLSKCAIVTNNNVGWLCGTGSFVMHLCLVESRYFLYVYATQYIQSFLNAASVGATMDNLNQDAFSNILIPIPPKNEQQRIINEIRHWFDLIDNINNSKQELVEIIGTTKSKVLDLAIHGKLVSQDLNDEPASELLKRIAPHTTPCDTSHYENLPSGWCILTVGEVADYINGRAFKPTEWEQKGLPIIRIQNLNDEDAAYNYSTAKFEDKYLVHKGDLLFAWAASLGTYIRQKDDAWLNQHIFKVIPKPFISRNFLYYSFINMIDDFYAESHGSGMVHITKGKFETRPILIPPIAEQKRIVERIETIFASLDTITAEL